jgi:outer membrane protein
MDFSPLSSRFSRLFPLLVGMALLESPFATAAGTPPASQAAGVTLAECYQKARQISENIGISAENYRLLQAQYRAQLGSILPHADWIKSQYYQDSSNTSGPNGATGSSLLAVQPLSYFQLQQPIFAGFRDWAVVDITKSQQEQAKLNQVLTDLQLLSDVATAFYASLTLQDQLAVFREIRKLNQDQVDQLNHWVNVGRSRPSEVLSAETQLASVDAQIEDTLRSLAQSRHLLVFLTGVPADVPLKDDPPEPPALTLDEAVNRSGKRPEIMSAAEGVHQADLNLRYARGGHFPTIGFLGRYYTERVGFLSDVRWDANITLDVPLYEGGSTQAQVREARSQQIIAQLTLSRTKRDVERGVRTAYDELTHAFSEAQAYDKAVQLAAKNYEVQKKEYRLGMINNLELLQLLTNMQNVRGQWLISRANAKLDDVRLRVSMGEGL